MKLCPRPPNSCFTSSIAIAEPKTGIQSGTLHGRLSPSKRPVTAADKSITVTRFFISSCHTSSNNTLDTTLTAITRAALVPNKYIPTSVAGISAISTFSIKVCVVSRVNRCGPCETRNFMPSSSSLQAYPCLL